MPDASDGRAESIRDLGALRLRSVRDGDRHIIAIAGEFDLATAHGVERELQRVEATDARIVVLDLRKLEFIDSSGLKVIVMAHRRQAGRLIVVKGPQRVQRVFEVCNVVRLLPLVDRPPGDADGAAAAHHSDGSHSTAGLRANQAALSAAVRELRSRDRLGYIR
ncbi:MAG: STAS domain-containing protein [Solirubrobacteraceae bacterium]